MLGDSGALPLRRHDNSWVFQVSGETSRHGPFWRRMRVQRFLEGCLRLGMAPAKLLNGQSRTWIVNGLANAEH